MTYSLNDIETIASVQTHPFTFYIPLRHIETFETRSAYYLTVPGHIFKHDKSEKFSKF